MTHSAFAASEVVLEPVPTASGWHAYRVDAGSYPLPVQERNRHGLFAERLSIAVTNTMAVLPSLWIDSQPLHHDGGTAIFSANSRRWKSRMGFCLNPFGEPPRKLRLSDLMDVDYGTPPKIFDRTAIHVSALTETKPAYHLIAGRGIGTLLYFSASGFDDPHLATAVAHFMKQSQSAMRPLMSPGEFQSLPFYLPLLSSRSISVATAQQLSSWLGLAQVYIHESYDAQEFVLLSRGDLAPAFEAAGLRRLSSSEGNVSWAYSNDDGDIGDL